MFKIFLEECEKYNLVKESVYQPDSFILCPKTTYPVIKTFKTKPSITVDRTLFREHSYTPDWYIEVTEKFFNTFPDHGLFFQTLGRNPKVIKTHKANACTWVDIKGGFNRHGGDRIFPIHQKLMWQIHKKLVNKVVPVDLFKKIGVVPDAIKWMKGRKTPTPKKAFMFTKTFEDLVAKKLL